MQAHGNQSSASLKTIGQYAFLNDVMLSSVRIPVGVTEIGNAAFSNVGVTAFEVETGNTACQSHKRSLYSAKEILLAYPLTTATEYTIADQFAWV